MKRFVIIASILYLSLGFIFAAYAYAHDLRAFRCDDLNAPHGYVTMSTKSFENPNPGTCTRRGLELSSIATIPFFTAFGVPILIARSMSGNN